MDSSRDEQLDFLYGEKLPSKIKADIRALMQANAPIDEIYEYAELSGYEKDNLELQNLLEGYESVSEESQSEGEGYWEKIKRGIQEVGWSFGLGL